MIISDEWGYTVALDRPDGSICARKFAGLNRALDWERAILAGGVIPEGQPVLVRFVGAHLAVSLRTEDGESVVCLWSALTVAGRQFPGIVAELTQ